MGSGRGKESVCVWGRGGVWSRLLSTGLRTIHLEDTCVNLMGVRGWGRWGWAPLVLVEHFKSSVMYLNEQARIDCLAQ